jgi:MoaA/NifB/PqqE/SkfB family radical SAM enzyme
MTTPTTITPLIPTKWIYDRAPQRVYWEITRACDLTCRHCRAEAVPQAHPDELDLTAGCELLERLTDFGEPLPHLVLTGGDPFKRKDLFVLIRAARDMGFHVSVSPSATQRLTAEAIERLKAAGVAAISLSIDGSTPERHDAFRGVPGTFERTMRAAAAARSAQLPVQINTLVAAETLADLPAIYALARDLGVARWSLFFLVSVGRGTTLQPISVAEGEQLMAWMASLPTGRPVVTTTEAPHFRRVATSVERRGGGHAGGIRDGNGIMFISHTGEVSPSGFLPLAAGNVRDKDPVAIYRGSELFRKLRDANQFLGRCGSCDFHWQCGGSRARAYAATGNVLAEDPLCPYEVTLPS